MAFFVLSLHRTDGKFQNPSSISPWVPRQDPESMCNFPVVFSGHYVSQDSMIDWPSSLCLPKEPEPLALGKYSGCQGLVCWLLFAWPSQQGSAPPRLSSTESNRIVCSTMSVLVEEKGAICTTVSVFHRVKRGYVFHHFCVLSMQRGLCLPPFLPSIESNGAMFSTMSVFCRGKWGYMNHRICLPLSQMCSVVANGAI